MSGASARLSAALDCVLSDHTVQCKRDGHAGWNGPEHVKLGSDSHGNFMVQLPCVVAIARQIDLRSANEWLRRLTQAEKSNVVVSERTWASSNNMTVRSCPVSEVQNVMEHAASHGNLPQRRMAIFPRSHLLSCARIWRSTARYADGPSGKAKGKTWR